MFNSLLLQVQGAAQGATQGAQGQSGLLMSVLPFLLIIVIFYFFIIRPQNKKQKETQKMIDALKKGDKVVTIGGIHGVVTNAKEKTVVVKVDSGTEIEFNRTAIATVLNPQPVAEKPSKADNKAKKAEEKEEKTETVTENAETAAEVVEENPESKTEA